MKQSNSNEVRKMQILNFPPEVFEVTKDGNCIRIDVKKEQLLQNGMVLYVDIDEPKQEDRGCGGFDGAKATLIYKNEPTPSLLDKLEKIDEIKKHDGAYYWTQEVPILINSLIHNQRILIEELKRL